MNSLNHYKTFLITRFWCRGFFQTGANCVLNGKIRIRAYGSITLGNSVTISGGSKFNPLAGNSESTLLAYPSAIIKIGDNTKISNAIVISHSSVSIGANVLIGSGCRIIDSDFHSLDAEKRINGSVKAAISKEIVIGEHAFIGAYTLILKGVKVGKKSIIGAGSVVTKSIPDFEIWAGNPARFIKSIHQIPHNLEDSKFGDS